MVVHDRALLAAAGVEVAPQVAVEIHPGYALDADDLRQRLVAGTKIEKDTYLV
jgi:hypothetical protein